MHDIEFLLNPEFPMKILINHGPTDKFLIEVTDASRFTYEEELAWKTKNPNYASTSPQDAYYLLRLEEIYLANPDIPDEELAQLVNNILLQAGDFWYDHITMSNN